jgi:hypothetical protein
MIRICIAVIVLLAASPAGAHNCKCRAMGVNYEQGQIACILGKLARCEMSQNVPTWTQIANTCPIARR